MHALLTKSLIAKTFAVASFTLFTAALSAEVLYVDNTPDDAPGDRYLEPIYTDLQTALAAASSGDIIRVAEGVYKPTASNDREASFVIPPNVTIEGGYTGEHIEMFLAIRNQDPLTNNTILSGDIGVEGDASDNSYHVVTNGSGSQGAVLDGFTITGGNANHPSDSTHRVGGGMYLQGALLSLRYCLIENNHAASGGGGIYLESNVSETEFSDLWILNNTSANDGAGLYCNLISDQVTFKNILFQGNSADDDGSGFFNLTSNPVIINSRFINNRGGSGNTPYGAGIYNHSNSNPTLFNCLFVGNHAEGGAAVRNFSNSSPHLINCTIAYNHGTVDTGGIISSSDSFPTLTNCILWGNTNTADPQIQGGTLSASSTANLIQGGYSARSSAVASTSNPLFLVTPNPGDGNWATPDNNEYGDLRLSANSSAIDAGVADVNTQSNDLNGGIRYNGVIDLGALEHNVPHLIYVDRGAEGANDGTSWENAFTSLQSALRSAGRGTTIRVSRGTYYPTTGSDRNASFVVNPGVFVFGGYRSNSPQTPRDPDPATNGTVLSGNIGQRFAETDNSYHVVTISNPEITAVIGKVDGFTITDGYDNSVGSPNGGAGLIAENPSGLRIITLQNLRFTDNQAIGTSYSSDGTDGADAFGGAVYLNGFVPSFIDCTFTNNHAVAGDGGDGDEGDDGSGQNGGDGGDAMGGAVYALQFASTTSTARITNCEFTNNTATAGKAGHGGHGRFSRNASSGNNGSSGSYSGKNGTDGGTANGGDGGNGGTARGGAIFFSFIKTSVSGSTFYANHVTSREGGDGGSGSGQTAGSGGDALDRPFGTVGAGGTGGHGGDGGHGGTGGLGGDGGDATGGAFFASGFGVLVEFTNSILVGNTAFALADGGKGGGGGRGGNGGDGGDGAEGRGFGSDGIGGNGGSAGRGGDGGDGGDGGIAQGGAVYTLTADGLRMVNCTVVSNEIAVNSDPGAFGFRGSPGLHGLGGQGEDNADDGSGGFGNTNNEFGTSGTAGVTGTSSGGSLYDQSNVNAIVLNSIFWNNQAYPLSTSSNTVASPHIGGKSLAASSRNNLVQNGLTGFSFLTEDPLFTRMPEPVGSNWRSSVGVPDFGDLTLTEASPAIDQGDNSATQITIDIAGNDRVIAGVIDLGAYEAEEPPVDDGGGNNNGGNGGDDDSGNTGGGSDDNNNNGGTGGGGSSNDPVEFNVFWDVDDTSEDVWVYSKWFGWFEDQNPPWFFHTDIGWVYVTDEQIDGSFWFWTEENGWSWSTSAIYPWFWSEQVATWIYYLEGSGRPTWYFNSTTESWQNKL